MPEEGLGGLAFATDFPAERMADRVEPHATAELLVEDSALQPGSTTWIGVRFKIADGWHLYWNGRNDTGSAPSFKVTLPPGYALGAWLWPVPKRHVSPGEILDHVYEGSVLLMAPLSVPADAKPGTKASLRVDAGWVVCDSNICVAEDAKVEAAIPVQKAVEPGAYTKEFESARQKQPKPWPMDSGKFSASISTTAGRRVATIHAKGATRLEFYPLLDGAEPGATIKSGAAAGDTLTIPLLDGPRGGGALKGVVAVARDGTDLSEFYTVVVGEQVGAVKGTK